MSDEFPPRREPVPTIPPPGERMNSQQTATFIGISDGTLRNWRCVGAGPAHYKFRGVVWYWRRDVVQFIQRGRVE
jgi:hypothetical protein